MLAAAAQTGMKKKITVVYSCLMTLIGRMSSPAPVYAGVTLPVWQQNTSSFPLIVFLRWPIVSVTHCLCQCRSSKSPGCGSVEVTTRRDASCRCGCLLPRRLIYYHQRRYYPTISEIYASIVGVLRYPTNFELLINTISVGLRLRDCACTAGHIYYRHFQIVPIPRCIHLTALLHSSHLMTCGRISYLIQPPVPVRTKTQDCTNSGECLRSRTCYCSF
jgi:hypothetical protein